MTKTMDEAIMTFAKDAHETYYTPPPNGLPDNPSGLHPVEYKVLVRLDPVEERTAGGIFIPDDRQDRDQMAQTYATLIEVGGNAFEGWEDRVPKPGDRILIDKYAGTTPKAGDFTDLYRVCNDKDIVAIIEE